MLVEISRPNEDGHVEFQDPTRTGLFIPIPASYFKTEKPRVVAFLKRLKLKS